MVATSVLASAAAAGQAGTAAPIAPLTASAPSGAAPSAAWQNPGGDIPTDPAWRQGTLPNGVRYAVRRSDHQASAISIRVRIGVGGLMEGDAQQGWSHLIEHMAFRGTAHYADGEGIKLWQRLGASFGSDTNAATTLRATTFQLDLPHADVAGYHHAMSALAEMMDSARIDPALLATERKVVEAEMAQRLTPLVRAVKDVQQPLMLAGTKAAVRDVIGTPATLANADAARLKAYYETWYRPDNAVVVVVGDADPAMLEDGIVRAFGDWKASMPKPAAPDWGSPAQPGTPVATVSNPQLPDQFTLAFVAPHPEGPYTVARQQQQYLDLVATAILSQRLASASRRDEAIVNAAAGRNEQRHIEDQFVIQVQSKPGQWKAALDQTYAVVNGLLAHAPAQAEIDQQVAGIATYLDRQVVAAATQHPPVLANDFINDFDGGDVTGSRDFYANLFAAQRATITPTTVEATLRRLLAPAPRLLVFGPQPVAGGAPAVGAALAEATRVAGGAAAELRTVSLDQLVLRGKPAAAGALVPIAPLRAQRVRFANGVELVLKRTTFEQGQVRVRVQIGGGLLGEPRGELGLWWTAAVLPIAGIGPFSGEELQRMAAGHQYAFAVAPAVDALSFSGITSPKDLAGMLKLMTGEIVAPRFEAATVNRLRETTIAGYAALYSQPASVLQAFGGAALHEGDARFDFPPRAQAETLALPAFRKFWTERLARGAVRVTIVGDFDPAAAVAAVGQTLGTLPVRPAVAMVATGVRAVHPGGPVVLRHDGDAGQALVAHVWPTLGESGATPAAREASAALELAAGIIRSNLTEGFREAQGGAYTPITLHEQLAQLPQYGVFLAGAQVQVARRAEFARALDAIVTDLAKNGPAPDAFDRAQATAISAVERNRGSNAWWLAALSGDLSDARVAQFAGRGADLRAVTADKVKLVVGRYLTPDAGFALDVLPRTATP